MLFIYYELNREY